MAGERLLSSPLLFLSLFHLSTFRTFDTLRYVKISYTSSNNEMKYENFPVQFISSLKHLLVSAFNVNGVAFLEYGRVYILTVSRGRTQLRFGISIPLILVDPSFRYTALIRPDILCALWTGWSWHTMRITQGNCSRALYNRRWLFTAISYAFSMKLITVVPRQDQKIAAASLYNAVTKSLKDYLQWLTKVVVYLSTPFVNLLYVLHYAFRDFISSETISNYRDYVGKLLNTFENVCTSYTIVYIF